jgi:hypothetical protein
MEYHGFYDYSVEVFNDSGQIATFGWVTNVWFIALWLNVRYSTWTHIRVYHRITQTFIGEYSREGDIPAKPRLS